jgi:hypothetical protein
MTCPLCVGEWDEQRCLRCGHFEGQRSSSWPLLKVPDLGEAPYPLVARSEYDRVVKILTSVHAAPLRMLNAVDCGGLLMDDVNITNLEWLIERCRGEISVIVNAHRNYYQSVESWLRDQEDITGTTVADFEKLDMIRRDRVVDVQCYPDTPVGFCRVLSGSLCDALSRMRSIVEFADGSR